jgi:hypothetical protein
MLSCKRYGIYWAYWHSSNALILYLEGVKFELSRDIYYRDQGFSSFFLVCPSKYWIVPRLGHYNLKNAIFRDVAPCGSCENRYFGVEKSATGELAVA